MKAKVFLLTGLFAGILAVGGVVCTYVSQEECTELRSIPSEELHKHPDILQYIQEHEEQLSVNSNSVEQDNSEKEINDETRNRLMEYYGLTETPQRSQTHFDVIVEEACRKGE
jgi:hypothetical protein